MKYEIKAEQLERIIAKLKELVEYYRIWGNIKSKSDAIAISKLESEIAALESEQEEPEQSSSEELREELIKFANVFLCDLHNFTMVEEFVDEYLQSLSKEQK